MTQEFTFKIPSLLKLLYPIHFPKKYGLLDKIFGRKLADQGVVWVKTPVGIEWKLDLRMVTHRWILYGKYDLHFLNWAQKNLPANGIVVDSGANIGQMTLYFAAWCKEGKVLAFEPDQEAHQWLSSCIQRNPKAPIELIKKGLGAEKSSATLLVPEDGKTQNLHAFWSYIGESQEGGQSISIVRLEDELAKRKIDHVDLWKLDVEGFEIPALKGAEELLRSGKIKAIYAELAVKNDNHLKINNYLNSLGYHCHYFDKSGKLYAVDAMPDYQTDGLFLKS